jgi:uncharacterized iron-regulated membrane protein
MRRWIFRVHLWLALLAGAFFVLLGLTGAIIAFEAPLDCLLHPHLSWVKASSEYRSLADILGSVKQKYPDDNIVAIRFSDSPRVAWQITIPSGVVCVNPHTGQILGLRERGQTILGLARELHVSLAAGNIGRTVIRWSDLAALALLGSGFYLWWPRRSLRLHRLDGSRRAWSEWHNAIGIGSLVFLVVVTATGACISFERPLRSMMVMGRFAPPSPERPEPPPPEPQDKPFLPPGRALAVVMAAFPAERPAMMTLPEYGGSYRFEMVGPHGSGADGERIVQLDPWSGEVLHVSQPEVRSLPDRVAAANEALHTGAWLGWPGRILMALASLAILPQAFTGMMMFWKRQPIPAERRVRRLQKGSLA